MVVLVLRANIFRSRERRARSLTCLFAGRSTWVRSYVGSYVPLPGHCCLLKSGNSCEHERATTITQVAERHASAARQTGGKFAHANLMTWLVGRLHAFVRRRRSGTVYGPPHAVQVELRGVRTHVPEALLQNRARILIRFDRAKIARERAMLCADA